MTMHHRYACRRLWALIGALGMLAAAAAPSAAQVEGIDWLDHSFGGGMQTFDLSPKTDAAAAVVVQDDGKVLLAASVNKYSSPNAIAVLRFLPDGRPDPGFGNAGRVLLANEGTPTIGMAVQDDGRIPAPETGTTIRAWGWNGLGQLGDDSTVQRNLPVAPPGSATTVSPAGGGFHSLSLRGDGTVLAAGWNGVGQLGDGTTTDRDTLALVPGLNDVTHIAAGAHHNLAVSGGRIYAWGWNASGQLGDGNLTNRHTPTLVPGLAGVVEVAAGAYHSLARLSDGTIWAWGSNVYGQLGDGTTTDRPRPVQVAGLRSASAISAGALHSLAVAVTTEWPAEGVWAWGWNAMGQSDPDSVGLPHVPWPQLVVPGRPVAMAAGGYHNVVIGGDGAVYTWGWNALGQLGTGTTNVVNRIVRVAGITDPVRVSAGGAHTMATDAGGRTWAWGWNAMGQLGDGTTTDHYSPNLVDTVDGATALAGGWYHSLGAVPSG